MVTVEGLSCVKNVFFSSPIKIGSYCMVTVDTSSFWRWFGVPDPIKHDNTGRKWLQHLLLPSGIVVFYRVGDSKPAEKEAGSNSNHFCYHAYFVGHFSYLDPNY